MRLSSVVVIAIVLLAPTTVAGQVTSGTELFPRRESDASPAVIAAILHSSFQYLATGDVLGVGELPDSLRHLAPEGPIAIDADASVNRGLVEAAAVTAGTPVRSLEQVQSCVVDQPRNCALVGASGVGTVFGIVVEGQVAYVDLQVHSVSRTTRRDATGAIIGSWRPYLRVVRLSLRSEDSRWTVVAKTPEIR